jgi:hypothetical protein
MFAAIRKTLSPRNRRPAGRKANRSPGLRLEALEERALLTAQPIVYTTLQENGDFGGTTATAQPVKLAPVMDSVVQGKLSNGADVDMFQVNLKAGQIFTADVNASPAMLSGLWGFGGQPVPQLSLLNNQGAALRANTARNGQSLEYRVSQSGTYYVELADSAPMSPLAINYTLHLRPIGLDDGSLDPSYLSRTGGGLYAWLDGTTFADGTKLLDISGPVGHGFGIRGNWTESVAFMNGLPGATYTATGTVDLETPLGEVPMPLPAVKGSSLTITTNPQQWGDAFGEIGSMNWNAPSDLSTYEALLGAVFPAGLLDLAAIRYGTKIGIGLGSDTALQNTGAPLNAAIPYLYFTANPAASSTMGSVTQVFSVVLDPADPFLYIGSPLTGDAFPITALAASKQGLIPFTPVDAPSQWSGSLRGHLYVEGQIDTTALTEVPSEIDGKLVLNLDPNHTGHPFGGATPLQLLSMYIAPGAVAAFDPTTAHQVMTNFSAGINGELKISPFDKFSDAVPDAVNRFGQNHSLVQYVLGKEVPRALTVGHASLIYDGPTESAYFRGGTANPFDGTPLAPFLAPYSADLDAGIKPGGAFYLDVKGPYQFAGLSGTGELKIENNWPTWQVTGFTTNRLGLTIPIFRYVPVTSISADVQFSYQVPYVVRATLDVNFSIAVDASGHLNYSGSGTASVDVYGPNHGWQVWDWEWQHVGDVGVGVSNGDMWFEVNGNRWDIALPH